MRLLTLCALLVGLVACAEQPDEAVLAGVGGSTPQYVVISFFEDFNKALKESPQSDDVRRRYWTDRLAGYFAPNERVDQREAISLALYTFASGSKQLPEDQRLSLDVSYNNLELVQQETDSARIRLVDGVLRLKITRIAPDGAQIPLRSDERPLGETIGQPDDIVPLVRVNGHWFLTEG